MKAETLIPNARMAVLMDAGLEYGIHPRKKREAGERMAILALSNTYGVKGLPDFAVYKSVEFKGDTAVVSFDRSKEWVYFKVESGDGEYYNEYTSRWVFEQFDLGPQETKIFKITFELKKATGNFEATIY
jgi:hypothetical protein